LQAGRTVLAGLPDRPAGADPGTGHRRMARRASRTGGGETDGGPRRGGPARRPGAQPSSPRPAPPRRGTFGAIGATLRGSDTRLATPRHGAAEAVEAPPSPGRRQQPPRRDPPAGGPL